MVRGLNLEEFVWKYYQFVKIPKGSPWFHFRNLSSNDVWSSSHLAVMVWCTSYVWLYLHHKRKKEKKSIKQDGYHQKQQKPRTANEKKEIKQASKAKQGKPKPRAYEKKTDQSRRIKGVIL